VNVARYEKNPIITTADVPPSREDFEVVCAFNAGVTTLGDETLMLIRTAERPIQEKGWVVFPVYDPQSGQTEVRRLKTSDPDVDVSDPRVIHHGLERYLTSISHLRLARSSDGLNFTVDAEPAIAPAAEYEAFGTEDPRITCIDGTYYIDYVGVSHLGVTTCLAKTTDFVTYERMGVIFCPDNRDVVLFPEKVDDRFVAYHRPAPRTIGTLSMWLARSPDLVYWGEHRHVISPRPDLWDSCRVGGGAPPIKTDRGWLSIYHGATLDDWYCLGALLTDLDEPHKVIARSTGPLLKPETDYEMEGFYGHVVFTCGTTLAGDRLRIYYGAADTVMAVVEVSLGELLDDLVE